MKRVNNFIQLNKQKFPSLLSSFVPEVALVHLSQTGKKSSGALVKAGDTVKEGQIISGEADGTAVHSPLPGKIDSIITCTMPDGSFGKAARINLGGSFSFLGKNKVGCEWKSLDGQVIRNKIRDKGVINTFHVPLLFFLCFQH